MDKIKRITELVKLLNGYSNAYYNENKSLVSDKEYDELYDELLSLERDTGVTFSNSPTQNVGYEVVSELKQVAHSHPLLSLDKTKNINDLIKFANRKKCILSAKMDGLTVLLTYNQGKLVKAETRGNGEVGEDITHNARVFENIPLTIDYQKKIEVEGEAIITYDDFQTINSHLSDEKYKNPRNLVSGSVRQLNSKIASKRHIKFIAWKLPLGFNFYIDGLHFLRQLGFEIVPLRLLDNCNTTILEQEINSIKDEAKSKSYPIDGLVLTYNDIKYGQSLGATGHHPKHSIAYKFYDEEYETTLKDVEWTVGQSGVITPIAVFEPIDIDGSIVSKASLHNVSIFRDLQLHYGDTITVYKANQIIPQVADNLSKNHNKKSVKKIIEIPNLCPVCNGNAVLVSNNPAEFLYCMNPYCKGKALGKLKQFVSKDCMNIKGLSESTLEKLMDNDYLHDFVDIYKLSQYAYQIKQLDGFNTLSTFKLLDAIEKSRTVTLDKFINALCIPYVGKENSKLIAKHCIYSINDFKFKLISRYDWTIIDGIGYSVSDSINEYYENNEEMFNELIQCLNFKNVESAHNNSSLSGLTFVITGTLYKHKNRDDLKEVIESMGGRVTDSVSKNTDYLINNDIDSKSGKNQKAKILNIPIITEEELIKMFNN